MGVRPAEAEEPGPRIWLAALWMTGAIASFSIMAVSGREIGAAHDTFEIMLYRSIVGVLIVSAVLTAGRHWHLVSRDALGMHAVRNCAHFIGQNLWFYAITLIPLAQLFALEFTTPLWVIVLAPVFLGEQLTRPKALAAMIGFAGILVVARPEPANISVGVLSGAGCAIFFALTMMLTKRLTRTEATASILFWLTGMQMILGMVAAGIDGKITLPDASTLPWLVLIGLGGLAAHFSITNALRVAPATVVVPFDFARLPTIAIVGMILYSEPLDIWVFAGGLMILAANIVNVKASVRSTS